MRGTVAKLRRGVRITGIVLEHNLLGQLKGLAGELSRNGDGEVRIPPEMPRKIREMMEAMGPTYIKMGQLLASRPDLVPKAFVDEFANMYDHVTPSAFPEVKALLESELGRPLEEVFSEFDPNPIASASIGQVHTARLRNGEKVAVKVQHPGIEEDVRLDFEIMKPLVRFIENLFASTRLFQPSDHLSEIQKMLDRELDYRHEARHHLQVYENFRDDPEVKIAKLYRNHSTRRVLVFEFIEGIHPSEVDADRLREMGYEGAKLARIITRAMAKMIFADRLFHADPSPGNLFIVGPTQVAFLDFGATGHVSRRRAERVMQLISGFVRDDVDDIAQALLELCNVLGEVDYATLKRDVERVLEYEEAQGLHVGDPVVMEMVSEIALRNNMLLPPDFFLVNRALFQMEGLCQKLMPAYDIVEELLPHVLRYTQKDYFSGDVQKELLRDAALEYAEMLRTFPRRVNSVVRKIEQDRLQVRMEWTGMREFAAGAERRTLRLSATVLLSAFLVALSLASLSQSGEVLTNVAFFGVLAVLAWAFVMLYFGETR
ncbi:MAG TPA: AarF/UbiB family protein [Candidatus Thermoplasmatota archaeon]|nr:AarF/UbiB family protein [Candidatus Thermoplasmatota archaeon]